MSEIHDLNKFGITTPVTLEGEVRTLRFEEGLPTAFLFDENHSNLNNCIDKNILNAIELINKGRVTIIGVESLAGGKSWDTENREYNEVYFDKKADDYYVKEYKSAGTKFADEVKKVTKDGICGVECWGMMHNISEDIVLKKYIEASIHPLNIKRSEHFIKTLFEKYSINKGNLILNCGSNHNAHIEKWVMDGEIDLRVGTKANYIRINTTV